MKKYKSIEIYAPIGLDKTLFIHAFLLNHHQHYRHIVYCSVSHSFSLMQAILNDVGFLNYLDKIKTISSSESFQERQITKLKNLKGPNLLLIDNVLCPSLLFDFNLIEQLGHQWSKIVFTNQPNKFPSFHTLTFPNIFCESKDKLNSDEFR